MKHIHRNIFDLLIIVILLAVIFFIAWLGMGAYSQHRIALLVNNKVYVEMLAAIREQACASTLQNSPSITPNPAPITKDELMKLQEAQDDLFDTNTVSFLYQFVTLIILTVGMSVLGLMYRNYRQEQERGIKAEEEKKAILSSVAPIMSGKMTGDLIASKLNLIYTICRLSLLTQDKDATKDRERSASLLLVEHYQDEIYDQLENALENKKGIEPAWQKVIIDLGERVGNILKEILETGKNEEKRFFEQLFEKNEQCIQFLWKNAKELEEYHVEHWKKLTKEDPSS
jgi:hypothetical protein